MKVGSLYVDLVARTGAFGATLTQAAQQIERFSKQAKKLSSEFAQVATAASAAFAGIALAGSKVNKEVGQAVDGIKNEFALLSGELARAMLPALRELGSGIRAIGEFVAQLSPSTKALVSDFAKFAVEALAVAKAIQLLSTGVTAIAGLTAALLPMLPVLAGVAAALGLLVVGVVAVHAAWRTNFGGIREIVASVAGKIQEYWASALEAMARMLDFFVDKSIAAAKLVVSAFSNLKSLTGASTAGDKNTLKGLDLLGSALKTGNTFQNLKAVFSEAGRQAKQVFADEFALTIKDLGLDGIVGQVSALFGGAGKAARNAAGKEMSTGSYPGGFRLGGQSEFELDDLANPFKDLKSGDSFLGELAQRQAEADKKRFDQQLETVNYLNEVEKRNAQAKRAALDAEFRVSQQIAAQRRAADEATRQAIAAVLGQVGNTVLGRSGRLGSTIQAGLQGGAAGGPVGAAVGVGADLLTQTKAFEQIAQAGEELLNTLVTAVEPAINALTPAFRGIFQVVGAVLVPTLQALQPIFDIVGKVLGDLVPTMMLFAEYTKGVAPLFKLLGDVLGGIFKAMEPLFRVLFGVVRVAISGILYVAKGFATVINGIFDVLRTVLAALFEVVTLGLGDGAGFARNVLGTAQLIDTSGIDASLASLAGASFDASVNQTHAAVAAGNLGNNLSTVNATVERFNEAFLNVPSGYKVALSRYGATAAEGATPYAGPPPPVSGNQTYVGSVTVSNSPDIGAILTSAQAAAERKNFQQSGSPVAPKGIGNSAPVAPWQPPPTGKSYW